MKRQRAKSNRIGAVQLSANQAAVLEAHETPPGIALKILFKHRRQANGQDAWHDAFSVVVSPERLIDLFDAMHRAVVLICPEVDRRQVRVRPFGDRP